MSDARHESDFVCNSLIGGTDGVCDCMQARVRELESERDAARESREWYAKCLAVALNENAVARKALEALENYHWHDMPALEAFEQVRGIASRALAALGTSVSPSVNPTGASFEQLVDRAGPLPTTGMAGSGPTGTAGTCATWCGQSWGQRPLDGTPYFGNVAAVFCTEACREAGRPLNPPTPSEGPR